MHSERGDIISSWLIQLLMIMLVVAFVGYELLSVAMTGLALDGDADRIANVAADAYDNEQRLPEAEAAAAAEAEERGATLTAIDVDDKVVIVTVTRPANTLVAHRLSFLDRFTQPSATRREKWRP